MNSKIVTSSKGVPPNTEQSGISLYTLLAAVVVLGVLTSVIVTSFNGSNSKGQAAYSLAHTLGQSANRFNLDTGCYPDHPAGLLEEAKADNNSCGITINGQGTWTGPYIEKSDMDGDDQAIVKNQISTGVTFDFANTTDADGDTIHTVVIDNLPEAIADATMKSCGATGDSSDSDYGADTSCSMDDGTNNKQVTYTYATGG